MEDLDDDAGTIQDLRGGRALEVAELAGRQLVVDDKDGGARLPGGRGRRRRCAAVLSRLRLRPLRLLQSLSPCPEDPWNAARAAGPGGQLSQLALAEQRGGAEALALLCHRADDLEAERLDRRLSSFSDDCCSASVTPESCTLTSTAFGRGASVEADMAVLAKHTPSAGPASQSRVTLAATQTQPVPRRAHTSV